MPPAVDPVSSRLKVWAVTMLILSIALTIFISIALPLTLPAAICAGVGLHRIQHRQPARARGVITWSAVCLCVAIGALAALAAYFMVASHAVRLGYFWS